MININSIIGELFRKKPEKGLELLEGDYQQISEKLDDINSETYRYLSLFLNESQDFDWKSEVEQILYDYCNLVNVEFERQGNPFAYNKTIFSNNGSGWKYAKGKDSNDYYTFHRVDKAVGVLDSKNDVDYIGLLESVISELSTSKAEGIKIAEELRKTLYCKF